MLPSKFLYLPFLAMASLHLGCSTLSANQAQPPPPMSPWNSALRLGLELGALGSMGYWGSRQGDGWMSYALAIGIPLAAAAAWGTFAVPDDPSRSGGAPVPVPGAVRLALEFTVFGFGAWTLHDSGYTTASLAFGGLTLFHNAVYHERVLWLLNVK